MTEDTYRILAEEDVDDSGLVSCDAVSVWRCDGCNFIHVSLYLGNKVIAEATLSNGAINDIERMVAEQRGQALQ